MENKRSNFLFLHLLFVSLCQLLRLLVYSIALNEACRILTLEELLLETVISWRMSSARTSPAILL
jgi:hypothetical protein